MGKRFSGFFFMLLGSGSLNFVGFLLYELMVCLFLSLFCYFCREFFNVVVWLVGRKYGVRSLLYMRLWGWKVIIGVKDIGKYGMGG